MPDSTRRKKEVGVIRECEINPEQMLDFGNILCYRSRVGLGLGLRLGIVIGLRLGLGVNIG